MVNFIASEYLRYRRLNRQSLSRIDCEHNYVALLATGEGNCALGHFQHSLCALHPSHPIRWQRTKCKHPIVLVQKKDVDWKLHADCMDRHQGNPTAPGNKKSVPALKMLLIQQSDTARLRGVREFDVRTDNGLGCRVMSRV